MTPDDFIFKTQPRAKQLEALCLSANKKVFALHMEQGTGKTKVIIDTAAYLYSHGNIDGMLIVAPNGVQLGWILDQIPIHMPAHVPVVSAVWNRNKPKEVERVFVRDVMGLRVLAINYEALITPKGKDLVSRFLRVYRSLWVNDESHRLKNSKSKAAEYCLAFGRLAAYRRNLTGTPATESPIDLYSQFNFLDPGILGFSTLTSFRAHFAHIEPPSSPLVKYVMDKLVAKYGRDRAAKMAPQLISKDKDGRPMYRNLEYLRSLIAPYSFRCLLSECADLPAVIYEKRYVTLEPEQRRMYNSLRDTMLLELREQGVMSVPLAITRLMRLQQIVGGFAPDEEGVGQAIFNTIPKLTALDDIVEDFPGKIVIWARFTNELRMIADHLTALGFGVARYWGDQGREERLENKQRFLTDQNCRFFVSQPRVGGTGLDGLQEVSNTTVYYSNEFPLTLRLQSESRTNRIGQTRPGVVIDIEAIDTLDRKIIETLRDKKELADCINGDTIKEWM